MYLIRGGVAEREWIGIFRDVVIYLIYIHKGVGS